MLEAINNGTQKKARLSIKDSILQFSANCATCTARHSGWFCSLGNAALADFELASTPRRLAAQTTLFSEGEEANNLYVVCSGFIKLTVGHHNEKQMIVRVAGPGSILGLYAAMSRGAYEVSASSITPAYLRQIEGESFYNFMQNHKEAQRQAVSSLCQEYRHALQGSCRIALADTVATRLGRLLVELAQQAGEIESNGSVRFSLLLTHEEMASMTCTTRETVTRTMGQFRKDGWISTQGTSVVIVHNMEKLQQL